MSNRLQTQLYLEEIFQTNKLLIVPNTELTTITIYLDCPSDCNKQEFDNKIRDAIPAHLNFETKPFSALGDTFNVIKSPNLPHIIKHFAIITSGNMKSFTACINIAFEFYGFSIENISYDKLTRRLVIKLGYPISKDELYRLTLFANEIAPLGTVVQIEQ